MHKGGIKSEIERAQLLVFPPTFIVSRACMRIFRLGFVSSRTNCLTNRCLAAFLTIGLILAACELTTNVYS